MNLITDRTQADVIRANEINKKVYDAWASAAASAVDADALIDPMEIAESTLTDAEFEEWLSGMKGAYNYTDLNRVESAVEEISNFFGYGLQTKTDWTMQDELTRAEMNRYISNLQFLMHKSGSSTTIPPNMSRISFESANNIEKMMLDAYKFKGKYPAGALAVGSTVYLNVGGIRREFIVVHQGNPNTSLYDESCNGTWLLMKDLYTIKRWDPKRTGFENNLDGYKTSEISAYLNGEFFGFLDESLQSSIKQVKIPYSTTTNSGDFGPVNSGANGFSTKVFLPAAYELGFVNTSSSNWLHVDGSKLDYFKSGTLDAANNLRIAYYNNEKLFWWMRTLPSAVYSGSAYCVNDRGDYNSRNIYLEYGVRPMFVLKSTTPIADITTKITPV